MQEEKRECCLVPFILALALVPLVCIIHKYDSGLGNEEWIVTGGDSYDFFLYYKSRLLLILGIVLSCFMVSQFLAGKVKTEIEKKTWAVLGAAGIFLLFSLVSVLFSEHPEDAFWGGYEQWEGFIVLFSYVAIFLFGYAFVKTENSLSFVYAGLTIGALLTGVLGMCQAFGFDYTKTDGMHWILTSMENAVKGMEFELAFEDGVSFSTLYNPNYVGSYAALLVPVLAGMVIWCKKIWLKAAAGIAAVGLIISVYASGSLTGAVGILGSAVLFIIFLLPVWKRHIRTGSIIVGCVAVGILAIAVVRPAPLEKIWSRLIQSSSVEEGEHIIEQMQLEDNTLSITSKSGKKVKIDISYNGFFQFDFPDEQYLPASYQITDASDGTMAVYMTDSEVINIGKTTSIAFETGEPVMQVLADGNQFTFVWYDEQLRYYSSSGKLANLREIDYAGFENNMRFATGRGYVWSRTFPLLAKHVIAGCGADNFIYDFPNDDYVGKQNYGFDNQVITKPHNMYLQIWVQDGLIALIGLLAIVVIYAIDVFRLYFHGSRTGFTAGMGICTFLGIAGYMITGLANDSTVCVAPVFWGLLGLGFTLNRNCRLKNKE